MALSQAGISSAQAAGTFECQGTAARIGQTNINQANPPGTPCATDNKFPINVPIPLGALGGLHILGVGAATEANDPPGVGIGQGGNAQAGTLGVNLKLLALNITVGAVRSLVSVHCPTGDLGPGTPPPVLTNHDTTDTVGVRINNLNLQFKEPVVLPLGIATIWLNREIRVPNRIIARAVEIQSPLLPTIVLGESVAGYSGNPCTA